MNQTEAQKIDDHLANAQASFALAENALMNSTEATERDYDVYFAHFHRLLMELLQLRIDFRKKHYLSNFPRPNTQNDGPMSDVVDSIANRR